MKAWMQDPVLQLFAGALLVLALATTIGSILSIRIAKRKPHAVIDNLNSRIFAWWWMVGLLGASFACGKSGVIALFAALSFFALREFITLAYTRRGDATANTSAIARPPIQTRLPPLACAPSIFSRSRRVAYKKASAPNVISASPMPMTA